MRIARSNRSGIQLRESSDCQSGERFVRLSFRIDYSYDVQGLREFKGCLNDEVCLDDLVCVTVDERYWHAGICQPNLRPVVILTERGRKQWGTIQGASGTFGLTNLPARCGKLDNALLSAALNFSISKISGIMCAVETYPGTKI